MALASLLVLLLTAAVQTVLLAECAFRYEASLRRRYVVLDWEVPLGHYLYREHFGFAATHAGHPAGEREYPTGVPHEDEFIGGQETYRGAFRVHIPYRGLLVVFL